MTIAVDFDGVIHQYSRGWADGTIYDPPMPGALDGLRALMTHDAVFIHTTREPEHVMPWLQQRGFDVTIDERCGACLDSADADCPSCQGNGLRTFWNLRGQLLVTSRKLPAVAYLDDRAVRFTTWGQALADLTPQVVAPAAPEQTDEPIEIRPWLVIQRYRPDHGGHTWCMRCWGHDGCDGALDLDLSSRQYAEHRARRHLAEHHPEEA